MDISKMTSAEESMTETTAPSTKDEEELVEKEDNSIEKDGEEEEGLFEKDVQGGGEDDGVNQVFKEVNAIDTHREESLEKQEEGGEDVEEAEQEANKKGEQRLSEKKAEAHTVVSGSAEKTTPSKKQKSKKGEAAMNVNNEVVKMRTEVKRVRALLIRKLLRHLADLKKKKGSEADLERNRRRAERLVEEISQMKRLRPDQVTKTALTSEFNFEKVCKDPTATMSQRALARIATHPQFSKKIDVVKAAVKAFEEERKKEKQKQKMTPFQEEEERDALKRKEEEETEDEEEMEDEEAEDDDENATTETAAPEEETTESSDQIKSEILARSKTVAISKSVKAQGKPTATQAPEKKPNLKPAPKLQQSNEDEEEDDEDDDEEEEEEDDDDDDDEEEEEKEEEEDSVKEKHSNDDDKEDEEEEKESDLESSDEEEKEYFDDSTEERFRKQSEESESEDDFFVGKVSKFKKKKKKAHAAPNLKSQTSDEGQTDKPQPELNCKAPKLASVFCSTLSSSQPGRGGLSRDRGRGRGGDRSRGRGRGAHRGGGPDRGRGGHRGGGLDRGRGGHRGGGPDRFSKSPSKFQKQDGEARGKPGFKNSERGSEARQFQSEDKDRPSTGRGTERGRGGVARQQDHRRPGGFSHQAPQQALHPSWEASKKRKEQQGQIMAFQGKKIKFDDDD